MEFTKAFIQKYSKIIVIIDIILLIFSIGFGNSGVLNGIVIFLWTNKTSLCHSDRVGKVIYEKVDNLWFSEKS